MEKNEIRTFSHTIKKKILEWIKDPNVRMDTTKHLEAEHSLPKS